VDAHSFPDHGAPAYPIRHRNRDACRSTLRTTRVRDFYRRWLPPVLPANKPTTYFNALDSGTGTGGPPHAHTFPSANWTGITPPRRAPVTWGSNG